MHQLRFGVYPSPAREGSNVRSTLSIRATIRMWENSSVESDSCLSKITHAQPNSHIWARMTAIFRPRTPPGLRAAAADVTTPHNTPDGRGGRFVPFTTRPSSFRARCGGRVAPVGPKKGWHCGVIKCAFTLGAENYPGTNG